MFDISVVERRKEVGERIAQERRKANLTQSKFADKLEEITGNRPRQSTITSWEHGLAFPKNIEMIFAMSKIFNCDCGYLLCDYDEKTYNSAEICNATGLSDYTVNTLCNLKVWGLENDVAPVIDALVLDFLYAEKGTAVAPLIYLINWFLKYRGNGKIDKMVHISGEVLDGQDPHGYIASSLKLNDRIIESAALTEIQQGLLSLKRRLLRKERGKNGKH